MQDTANRPDPPLEPHPWQSPDGEPPATPRDWREATLAQIEAWIEEEERLVAEIERRIAAAAGNVLPFAAPNPGGRRAFDGGDTDG